jgi:DNA-binding response OmpR family regulator
VHRVALVDTSVEFLKRVLLVLDNQAIGATVQQELNDSGYDVHWARSLAEAETMWQPNVFDVVLLDLRNDGQRSREFVSRIRAVAPHQRIHLLQRRHSRVA